MRKLLITAVAAALVASLLGAPTAVAEERPHEQLKQRVLQPRARTLAADEGTGNGIYRVHVERERGLAPGTFTVLTGPDNPAGEGLNVLFGDGVPGTSYMIVRQSTDDGEITDWVQGQLITHATERSLDEYYWYTETLDSGYVSYWSSIWFGTISQRVEVVGKTQADTRVEVTTTVDPERADELQVQYIWDVATGADDGPALQQLTATSQFSPYAPVINNEKLLTDTTRIAVVDNEDNVAGPSPALATAVTATGGVESMQYVCWPDAIYAEFGAYEVWDQYDISTPDSECVNTDGDNDSAVIMTFETGSEVSASLAMTPGTPYPTAIDARPVLLRLLPAFRATLTDRAEGEPLAGRKINFLVGSTVRCSAVTNAAGVASCGTLTDALAAVLALGYTARYPGNAIWASSSDKGGIA
ncbi:hypothetical protein [Microlunatus parietis]|uniref:Uncharacterized protein n=1 Tax=Microlunatus parietis TaxID=682979 RepID=A0A7Y9L9R6_9ACTN|nr:hypothetical protein [Microlunatus parietis]NYE72059.1 hypothetical protein [Microlunatus parietis]